MVMTLLFPASQNTALKRGGYSVKSRLPKHLTSDQKTKLLQYFTKAGWAH